MLSDIKQNQNAKQKITGDDRNGIRSQHFERNNSVLNCPWISAFFIYLNDQHSITAITVQGSELLCKLLFTLSVQTGVNTDSLGPVYNQ